VISNKNYLIAFLSLVVVGLAFVTWSEYNQMIKLRAQLADVDSAALKRELAADKKTIKSLEDRLAAMRGRRNGGDGPQEAGDGPGGDGGPDRRGGRFGAFAALSGNPEFQKLLAIQMKGRISATYGALFKSLNLSPEQLTQFQSLLADRQQAMMDTMQAAREQGINPREDPDGFKTLMSQTLAQSDQSIQQALGDAGFQQYQQYQQTLPERNTVNTLQQSLSYTQTPLTDDETNAMINLLAQTQPARADRDAGPRDHGPHERRRERQGDGGHDRPGLDRPVRPAGLGPGADPGAAAGPAADPADDAPGQPAARDDRPRDAQGLTQGTGANIFTLVGSERGIVSSQPP